MAQAESVSITSRRGFLVGSAVASAAIVTPMAVVAAQGATVEGEASPGLVALRGRLYAAFDEMEDASDAAFEAFEEVKAWERKNPEPRRLDDKGEPTPNFSVLATQWMQDRQKAYRQSGQVKKTDAYHAAVRDFQELVKEVCAFDAVTMADIYCKAEIAAAADNDDNLIAKSVVMDLTNLKQASA